MRLLSRNKRHYDVVEEASRLASERGYSMEDIRLVGQDDFTHGVHYYVLGINPQSVWEDAHYAIWKMIDWSMHPNSNDRARGACFAQGYYTIPDDRARDILESMTLEEIHGFSWNIPGTDEPLPGSAGYWQRKGHLR